VRVKIVSVLRAKVYRRAANMLQKNPTRKAEITA
jgi:hypothetical protein